MLGTVTVVTNVQNAQRNQHQMLEKGCGNGWREIDCGNGCSECRKGDMFMLP